jgi:hypothetical protein
MKVLSLDFLTRWTFMFLFSSFVLLLGIIGIIYALIFLDYLMGNAVIWVIPVKKLRAYAVLSTAGGFFMTNGYLLSLWLANKKQKDFT